MQKWQEWEKAFIILTIPNFHLKDIAKHLNKTHGSLRVYVERHLKIKKRENVKPKINTKRYMLYIMEEVGKFKGRSMWKCKCDCGNIVTLNSSALNRPQKSCGCIKKKPCNYIDSYYKRLKIAATHGRNIEFKISLEYITSLLKKQNNKCALTGWPIEINYQRLIGTDKRSQGTASIDRINSNIGYIEGNIQWVHKDVNKMKQTYSQGRYIEVCKAVSKYNTEEKS